MSFLNNLKTRIAIAADVAAEKIKDSLAEETVAAKRIEICSACPELIKLTNTCKSCGCFMSAKTKLKSAECPLQKW